MKYTLKLLFIFSLVHSLSYSQPYETLKLDLDKCFEIAENKNFDIQLIEYQLDASKAQLNQAFGNYLPGINFNSGYNVQNFQIPINGGQEYRFVENRVYNMGVNANYTLFDGFNREAQYQQAEHTLNQTKLNAVQLESSVKNQIYQNYITAILNQQVYKIRTENLNIGQKDLERLQALFDAGSIPIVDIYTQEAEIARRELAVIQAENDVQISKANLLNVLGLDPTIDAELDINSFPQDITEDEISDFRLKLGSLNGAVRTSMDNRADLEASEFQQRFSESQIDIAYSSYYPSLSLNGGWNWNNTQFSDFDVNGRFTFGVNLQVPIFSRFRINNSVQNSQLQYEQSAASYERLKQDIKTAVKTAFLTLQSSEKQIVIAKKSLKASKLSYESQKERYNLGASNLNDVLIANTNFISSQIEYINAVYGLIQAQKQIEFQTGIME